MFEPENIMVVSQEWYTHYKEREVSYCDIYDCDDCPRYGDDCDGEGTDEWED